MKKLTIVIPVKNVNDALFKTLSSIQHSGDVDVIVKSQVELDTKSLSLLGSFPRVSVVAIEDSSVYQAFNQAIDYVSSEYVLFMGAGDILLNPIDIGALVKIDALFVKVRSESFGLLGFYSSKVLFQMPHHQGIIFKTSIVKELKFNEAYTIAGDLDFIIRAVKNIDLNYRFIFHPTVDIDREGLSKSIRFRSILRREVFEINMQYASFVRKVFLLMWFYLGKL